MNSIKATEVNRCPRDQRCFAARSKALVRHRLPTRSLQSKDGGRERGHCLDDTNVTSISSDLSVLSVVEVTSRIDATPSISSEKVMPNNFEVAAFCSACPRKGHYSLDLCDIDNVTVIQEEDHCSPAKEQHQQVAFRVAPLAMKSDKKKSRHLLSKQKECTSFDGVENYSYDDRQGHYSMEFICDEDNSWNTQKINTTHYRSKSLDTVIEEMQGVSPTPWNRLAESKAFASSSSRKESTAKSSKEIIFKPSTKEIENRKVSPPSLFSFVA